MVVKTLGVLDEDQANNVSFSAEKGNNVSFGVKHGNNVSFKQVLSQKENSTETVYEYFSFSTGVLTIVCSTLLFVNILTCVSMRRCKRIPYACKLLTCIICICDAVFISIVLSGFLLKGVEFSDITRSIFTEVGRVFLVVSWLTITLMSVERMICLYFPNMYAKYSSKRNIRMFTLLTLGTCVFMKLFARYVVYPIVNGTDFMDFVGNSKDLNINTFILGICLLTNVLCYIAIFNVVQKQVRRMKQIAPIHWIKATASYASTKAVCIIFTVFVIFHAPLFVAFVFYSGTTKASSSSRYLNFILMLIMCAIYPILYAWRFKECRYQTIVIFSKLLCIASWRMERMRMNVYSIEPSPTRSSENQEPA